MPKHMMTLCLAEDRRIQVPYDPAHMEFTVGDQAVRNPFTTECGRFYTSPTYYGFEIMTTGGNMPAYYLDLPSGDYLLLTTSDGHLPDEESDVEDAVMGLYTKSGEQLAEIRIAGIPLEYSGQGHQEPVLFVSQESLEFVKAEQAEVRVTVRYAENDLCNVALFTRQDQGEVDRLNDLLKHTENVHGELTSALELVVNQREHALVLAEKVRDAVPGLKAKYLRDLIVYLYESAKGIPPPPPAIELEPGKCGQCGATTVEACNAAGCTLLENGNCAPEGTATANRSQGCTFAEAQNAVTDANYREDAERIAFSALGIPWRDTGAQARRVAEAAVAELRGAYRACAHVGELLEPPFKKGDIVRYGSGPSALMRLDSPHVGGWHGVHCLGGYTYSSNLTLATPEEVETFNTLRAETLKRQGRTE